MIREMGIATTSLWGVIMLIVTSGPSVTDELKNRIGMMVLCKPITRGNFLVGKFLGIFWAIFLGIIFLCLIHILTMWIFAEGILLEGNYFVFADAYGRTGLTIWEYLWKQFFLATCVCVLEAAFLVSIQMIILTSIAVSLATFSPILVTVSVILGIYVLGNLSTYLIMGIRALGGLPYYITMGFYYVLPNFGYFNLAETFSEGKIISVSYLIYSFGYGIFFTALILFLGIHIFRKSDLL